MDDVPGGSRVEDQSMVQRSKFTVSSSCFSINMTMMVCCCRLLVSLQLLRGLCGLTVPPLLRRSDGLRHVDPSTRTAITAISSTVTTIPEAQQQADVVVSSGDGSFYIPNKKPRPLHQNWWPVSALYALQESRPNAIQVLDKKLVAVYDENHVVWNVLDDRCSHRFAPLSEGRRVVTNTTMDYDSDSSESAAAESATKTIRTCRLQCAYHGWEFETATGKCTLVPQQQDKVDKARAVQTYPTRSDAGMLWVWTDTETGHSLAPTIPLPIDPLLRSHVAHYGETSCYMRDLPYGMEILGENLLDLSHLPFAHHSVGRLNRNIGGSLPTRMLSEAERKENVLWEKKYHNNNTEEEETMALATFQAEIVNASLHDPIFKAFASAGIAGAGVPPEDWTTTTAYYDPCHVRYRRWRGTASHVELFLCPTSQGRSRVFLFNAMERHEHGIRGVQQKTPPRLGRILTALKPSTWKATMMRMAFQSMLAGHRGHLISHLIFDGDGIFLHKQGNRMKQANLTYSDYSTPSSADILLNAFRRFLDTAATITRNSSSNQKQHQDDLAMMASAVVGMDNYGDDAPRSEMLDRYNTHTKDCPVCSNALQRARRSKRRLGIFQTALHGSAGAMTTASLVLLLAKVTIRTCANPLVSVALNRLVAATAALAWFGSWAALCAEKKLDKKINSFIFEDYVHAEKN